MEAPQLGQHPRHQRGGRQRPDAKGGVAELAFTVEPQIAFLAAGLGQDAAGALDEIDTVHATADDAKLALFQFLSLLAIAQPLAILVTGMLGVWLMPRYKGALADLPWWAMAAILLLGDDLRRYCQMFYPLLQSRRAHSALRAGGKAYAEQETHPDATAGTRTLS